MSIPSNPVEGAAVPPAVRPLPQPRELDLFAFALLLLRNLHLILGCGVIAFLFMVVAMLRAKPLYPSTAVMLIPQGNTTTAAMQASIAMNTADLLGGGYELYADILKSRSVGDQIIQDFDLKKVYGVKELEYAEITLAGATKVETQREGIVRVTVQDTDPQRAADIANDYLNQLNILNYRLALNAAKAERVYLEGEMIAEKNALSDAEVALKKLQESTSGLPPDTQAAAGLSALEQTRAQLRADQIRLSALLTGETENNPEVVRLRSQIAGLTAQVNALQSGERSTANGDPIAAVPEQALEYTRRLREVKFHESLFGLLEAQYEQAKEREAKSPSIVQVLDKAVPSFRKSWPPRTYYCLMAGVLGIFAGIFLVLLRALVVSYINNPLNADKFVQLKQLYRKQQKA